MSKSFNNLLEEAKTHIEFWIQEAIVDFTEEVFRKMGEQKVTRAKLAEKINVNPAYITKILRGDTNFTLETMVKVARALNSRVRIHLQREDCHSEWMEFLKTEPMTPDPKIISPEWNDAPFQADKKIIAFSYNEPISTGTS
jgi:transcriptional regulator with XRE-family HTH domain